MRSYSHFTLEDRNSLYELRKGGKSVREIARILHRAPSSISRELARNCNKNGSYNPWRATILYILRRRKSHKPSRFEREPDLRCWTVEKLKMFWPPEAIAARWKREHPNDKLSFSTIYRALKGSKQKSRLLKECSRERNLRRRGKRAYTHNYSSIHPDHFITERPEEANQRTRFGDWEGDTIYGGIGKGLIVTCVDRKSRLACAALLHSRNKEQTKEAIVQALKGEIVHSLTLDNGSEFALFREIEQQLNTTVYFAHPHAPWERGTNENTNGLLRFFFPKGTNFHKVTQQELDKVLYLINSRPRKCLGWLSPVEFIRCCT